MQRRNKERSAGGLRVVVGVLPSTIIGMSHGEKSFDTNKIQASAGSSPLEVLFNWWPYGERFQRSGTGERSAGRAWKRYLVQFDRLVLRFKRFSQTHHEAITPAVVFRIPRDSASSHGSSVHSHLKSAVAKMLPSRCCRMDGKESLLGLCWDSCQLCSHCSLYSEFRLATNHRETHRIPHDGDFVSGTGR